MKEHSYCSKTTRLTEKISVASSSRKLYYLSSGTFVYAFDFFQNFAVFSITETCKN